MDMEGGRLDNVGKMSSKVIANTSGDVNTVTAIALGDASVTLTAANMTGSRIFTITPTVARTLTVATAVDIIAQLTGYEVGSNFSFTVINTAAFDVTLATNTGVTLVGKMIVNNGSGTWRVRVDSSTTVTIYTEGAIVPSKVVQVVNTQTSAVATGTTIIPADDTIPQITEGDQYMTRTITPKHADNILLIDVVLLRSGSVAAKSTVSLFVGATANALATACTQIRDVADQNTISFRHRMVAGATSELTFRVRAGMHSAGTTTVNGEAGVRFWGGTSASSITITELTP